MFLKTEPVLGDKGGRKSPAGLLAQPTSRQAGKDWSWGFLYHAAKGYGCNCFFHRWDTPSQHHSVGQVVLPGTNLVLPGEVIVTAVHERACKSLMGRSPAIARSDKWASWEAIPAHAQGVQTIAASLQQTSVQWVGNIVYALAAQPGSVLQLLMLL